MLAKHLIVKRHEWPPVIIDLFFLEVLFEVLQHPFDILYYLQQRARFFDKLITDSEFNPLGFHMRGKLYVPQDATFMAVESDFGDVVTDCLAAKEAERPLSKEFPPLEERVNVPAITALISAMKEGPPEIAGAAIELLDFSEEALQGIADNIAALQAEVRAGKPFKAFSIETSHGGLSYVAVGALDERTVATAEAIARKHKYGQKKDRWYLILDHVHSERLVDRIAVVLQEWEKSDEMDKFLEDVGPLFKQTYVSSEPPAAKEKDA